MPASNPNVPAPAGGLRLVRPLPVVPSPATGGGRADIAELDAAMRRHPAGKAAAATPPVVRGDDVVFVPVLRPPMRLDRPAALETASGGTPCAR